jgi:hypothetical protein
MDETFPCPKCGQTLTRPQHAVSMQCPACKNFVIIPNRETGEAPALTQQDRAILALIRKGDKIGAIKLYRGMTGAGLQESKEAIDRMAASQQPFDPVAAMYGRSQAPAASRSATPEQLQTIVLMMLAGGNREEAIKTYMRITNTDPERAAAEVDAIARMGSTQQFGGMPVTLERMRKARMMVILVGFLVILAFGLAMTFFVMK